MKFAHSFQKALELEEFPSAWVNAAISYRRLKKCIKDVQLELVELGLDIDTLRRELTSFQYTFDGPGNRKELKPRLLFRIEASNGIPISASLSPETRKLLASPEMEQNISTKDETARLAGKHASYLLAPAVRTVEIPLTSDSKFFHLLATEIVTLRALEDQKGTRLTADIVHLGEVIRIAAEPKSQSKVNDLYTWREIFALYTESQIFFPMHGHAQRTRTSSSVQEQLQQFSVRLEQVARRFRRYDSKAALESFLALNWTLFRSLKFQELNAMAMSKILKKFDKRTALGARETFPAIIASESFSPSEFAKSICFQISDKLVNVVPQLSDYLCPVCFSVSFKPIRLRCNHIFCIRCLVVMQRSRQDHCPLCRGSVVMEADSTNLDLDMLVSTLELHMLDRTGHISSIS